MARLSLTTTDSHSQSKKNQRIDGLIRLLPDCYFVDNQVLDIGADLKPSSCGETEIVDVMRKYMNMDQLFVQQLDRGFAWLDTETHESLMLASSFIETIEQRQGLKIAAIEEVAFLKGFITATQLEELASPLKNDYGNYLPSVIKHSAPNR